MTKTLKSQWQSFAPLTRQKHFIRLLSAQLLGQIGMNALHFILVVQVYQRTGNNFVVGILIALLSLPGIFTTQLSGVFADNFNRRKLLVAINGFRMLVTILILASFKLPGILILLAFFITMASQGLVPIVQSVIPQIVKKDKIMEANSLYTFTVYSSLLIGFSIAGPLLEFTGELVSLIILSSMFMAAMILYRTLPSLSSNNGAIKKTIAERLEIRRLRLQFLEGWNYIKKQRSILVIISQVAFIFAVERSVIALVPSLAKDFFDFSISAISFYMIMPLALGTITGVATVNILKRKTHLTKLMTTGLIMDAMVLLLFPLYHEIIELLNTVGINLDSPLLLRVYAVSLSFISGLADVMIIVSAQTYIHNFVTDEIRGRVFAFLMSTMNLFGVPLVLLISLFADIVNIMATLVTFGSATLIVAYFGWKFFKKMPKVGQNIQTTPSIDKV